ncbi:MAG: RagB/SusD family nutrient uptake outer membrane protein [Rhodothermales bacterium]
MRDTFNTLRIGLFVCLLFVWAGCDSFLEPDPASFSTTANFYESPAQFEQAVVGAYAQFRLFVGDEDYRYATDMRGPNITRHFDVNLPHTVAGTPQLDEWSMDVANGVIARNWTRAYEVIKETNVILNRIDPIEFPDEAQKNRLIGEAKVMRAFAFWVGVQFWGDMPLLLTEVSTPGEAVPETGRDSKAAVIQQIVTDLQDAINKLPATYSGGDVGRITRGAAQTLLGKTYMLTGEWSSAISQFEAVDAGPYSLMPSYREVFNPANKNNAESILELQYDPNIPGQGELPAMLVDVLPYTSASEISEAATVPLGRYMPTPDAIAKFEIGDLRFEDSIAWWEKAGNSTSPEIAFGDSIPYFNKFFWKEAINGQAQMNVNWIVFRLSDVLLSAAEAHWRNGSDGQAMAYLDRVRSRAGLPSVNLADFSGALTGSSMGDAILHERDVELLGEGHNWLDLLRFGDNVAMSAMVDHGNKFRARDSKTADVYVIQDYKLLYMIPPREVLLGQLAQNPGW